MGRQLPPNFEARARAYAQLGYTAPQIARTLRVTADTVLQALAPRQGRTQRRQFTRDQERARRRGITKTLAEHWEAVKATAQKRILTDPTSSLLLLSLDLGVSLHRLTGLRRDMRTAGAIK